MASDATKSQVLLILTIFFFVVTIGLAFAAFYLDASWQSTYEEILRSQHRAELLAGRAQDRISERNEALDLLLGPGGRSAVSSYTELQTTSSEDYFRPAAEAIARNRQRLARMSEEEPPEGDTSEVPARLVEYYTDGEGADFERVVTDLIDEVQATHVLLPRLRVQVESQVVHAQTTRQTGQQQINYADDEKEEIREELTRAQDQILDLNRESDLLDRNHQDRMLDLEGELERELEAARIQNTQLENQILAHQDRISELQERRERTIDELAADGRITHAENDIDLAWIDLSEADGVRRGQVFEVFQFARGGRRKVKGLVEVRDVGESVSQVAIVEGYFMRDEETGEVDPLFRRGQSVPSGWSRFRLPRPTDPIIRGDLVRSPVYQRDESPIFSFVGEELSNDRYEMAHLEEQIRAHGGRIGNQITIETDFVIVLEDAEEQEPDELARALQYGVMQMSEADILEYVGRR